MHGQAAEGVAPARGPTPVPPAVVAAGGTQLGEEERDAGANDMTERSPEHTDPVRVLIVTDGSGASADAAATAAELFPDAELSVMTTVAVTRDVYEGTTGFAGPVLSDDELTEIERSRRVDAMGRTAATARALGGRPARLLEQEGEPDVAVERVLRRSEPDVVVVAAECRSPSGGDLLDRLDRPIVIVPRRRRAHDEH